MSPLTITAEAVAQIQAVLTSENVPADFCLRVGIHGGGPGCSGVNYLLGFDRKAENDRQYEINGIPVIIDQRHSMYVLGMEIDWHENEHQKGFVFNNPVAREQAEKDENLPEKSS